MPKEHSPIPHRSASIPHRTLPLQNELSLNIQLTIPFKKAEKVFVPITAISKTSSSTISSSSPLSSPTFTLPSTSLSTKSSATSPNLSNSSSLPTTSGISLNPSASLASSTSSLREEPKVTQLFQHDFGSNHEKTSTSIDLTKQTFNHDDDINNEEEEVEEILEPLTIDFLLPLPTSLLPKRIMRVETKSVKGPSNNDYLANLLSACDNLPPYISEPVLQVVDSIVEKHQQDIKDQSGLESLISCDISSCARAWSGWFRKEYLRYAPITVEKADEKFTRIYHELIHTPEAMTLLKIEKDYAFGVANMNQRKNQKLHEIEVRHAQESKKNTRFLFSRKSIHDEDEQKLKVVQRSELEAEEIKWKDELNILKAQQREEYRNLVLLLYDDDEDEDEDDDDDDDDDGNDSYNNNNQKQQSEKKSQNNAQIKRKQSLHSHRSNSSFLDNTTCGSGSGDVSGSRSADELSIGAGTSTPFQRIQMEESFSVHLGGQMRETRNLRLICGDFGQMYLYGSCNSTDWAMRAVTAMSLYSENLKATILPVKYIPPTSLPQGSRRSRGGSRGPDTIDQDGNNFGDSYNILREKIEMVYGTQSGKDFLEVCDASSEFHFPPLFEQLAEVFQSIGNLDVGDVYITRHSNLADVHVVFHVVVDDSIWKPDLHHRSPILVGLRNILSIAGQHSITDITVPLLLTLSLPDDLKASWYLQRAELVLKCVKGFMLDCTSWAGLQDTQTVQFLIPTSAQSYFDNFSQKISETFKLSTPLSL